MKSKNEKKKGGEYKEKNGSIHSQFLYRVGYDINGTVFWPKKSALRKWSIC